jgi:electron transfer flavoprotein beta subunit
VKILVCLKQVPGKDAPLRIDGSQRGIRDDVPFEINEPDLFALEAALRLKEAHPGSPPQNGSEVAVITVGPARASQALREALAKGADRAIHVDGAEAPQLDAYSIAEAITRSIAGERYDLILTGLQADDDGFGQTGVIIAELLGAPHATIIMEIQPLESAGRIRVKRELEGGRFQWVELPTPAVLTIQSGIGKLRYATLLGIKQAKNKPLRHTTLEEQGVAPSLNRLVLNRLFTPPKRQGGVILTGTVAEQAAKLAERIRREVPR